MHSAISSMTSLRPCCPSFNVACAKLTFPVDYILFATLDVDLDLNPNEVSDATYVSRDELAAMFADPKQSFTPWFRLIARDLLLPWWGEMLEKSTAAGWDEKAGKGVVRADLLANGPKVNDLIKMV